MTTPIELNEWQALIKHHADVSPLHMQDCFKDDPLRDERMRITQGGLTFNYARNRLIPETINLLCNLAQAVNLGDRIDHLFNGQPINVSENRPALHTALRSRADKLIYQGNNILNDVFNSREQMRLFVEKVHSQEIRGITDKPFQHIVNIGIGGSYTGPLMTTQALKDFAVSSLRFHFISNIDQAHLEDVLEQIDPETTLFIISSKSFTTLETLTNARVILAWMQSKLGVEVLTKHFIAVTAATDKARLFGIATQHIFPFWEWVGGRFSIWSAIGLPLMLMIGYENFMAFLAGAEQMDSHFREAPFSENMPVMLGLLGIWYVNFFGAQAQAIIPYAYRLRYLVPYLQQAEMESNGKSIDLNGRPIRYATCPVIFGEEGCIGQHAYHQLLHQGQPFIPVDFILVKSFHSANNMLADLVKDFPALQTASGLSQAQALVQGKPDAPTPHQMLSGNKPCNILLLNEINPKNLGMLIALYEQKIFVQSVIWNINPFDQWGVELGKQLLPNFFAQLQHHEISV